MQPLVRSHVPLPLLALTALLIVVNQYLLRDTGILSTASLKVTDTLYHARPRVSSYGFTPKEIVILGLDDESFRELNLKWPWDRSYFGEILKKLQESGPRVIGLDYNFIGSSVNPESDQNLAQAIQDAGNVVISSYFGNDGVYAKPLEMIAEASRGYGFANKLEDPDSSNRRMQIVRPFRLPSPAFNLGSVIAFEYLGLKPSESVAWSNNELVLELPEHTSPRELKEYRIRTNLKAGMWSSYRHPPSHFTFIPVWRLMKDEIPPQLFKDKIVLMGSTSFSLHDYHLTPWGIIPGVYLVANDIAVILHQDFIREVAPKILWPLLAVLIMFFTFVVYRLSAIFQFAATLAALAFAYGLSLYLFSVKNIMLEPFPIMFIVTVNYLVIVLFSWAQTFFENLMLQKMVVRDDLTGLYVHRFFVPALQATYEKSLHNSSEFCVAMIDIDRFKKVNDTYGHETGNAVLKKLGGIMSKNVRAIDIAARYGGEEFGLILVETGPQGAHDCVERIRKSVEAVEFESDQGKFRVTLSCGIASNRHPDVHRAEDLTLVADRALYRSKNAGRNRITLA